jgi:hypothetical protein
MFELLEFRGKIPKLKKIKIRIRVNGLKFLILNLFMNSGSKLERPPQNKCFLDS